MILEVRISADDSCDVFYYDRGAYYFKVSLREEGYVLEAGVHGENKPVTTAVTDIPALDLKDRDRVASVLAQVEDSSFPSKLSNVIKRDGVGIGGEAISVVVESLCARGAFEIVSDSKQRFGEGQGAQ